MFPARLHAVVWSCCDGNSSPDPPAAKNLLLDLRESGQAPDVSYPVSSGRTPEARTLYAELQVALHRKSICNIFARVVLMLSGGHPAEMSSVRFPALWRDLSASSKIPVCPAGTTRLLSCRRQVGVILRFTFFYRQRAAIVRYLCWRYSVASPEIRVHVAQCSCAEGHTGDGRLTDGV